MQKTFPYLFSYNEGKFFYLGLGEKIWEADFLKVAILITKCSFKFERKIVQEYLEVKRGIGCFANRYNFKDMTQIRK